MTTLGHEKVRRFNIAMDDLLRVRGIERVGNLDAQRQRGFNLQRPRSDAVPQRHPVEKLHGDERLAVLLADVINCADVGVIQCGRSLGFALEAGEGLRVAGNVLGQELEGDKTMKPCVLGLVDNSHATAAQSLDDAVVRDGLADHSGDAWFSARFILRIGHPLVNE